MSDLKYHPERIVLAAANIRFGRAHLLGVDRSGYLRLRALCGRKMMYTDIEQEHRDICQKCAREVAKRSFAWLEGLYQRKGDR